MGFELKASSLPGKLRAAELQSWSLHLMLVAQLLLGKESLASSIENEAPLEMVLYGSKSTVCGCLGAC